MSVTLLGVYLIDATSGVVRVHVDECTDRSDCRNRRVKHCLRSRRVTKVGLDALCAGLGQQLDDFVVVAPPRPLRVRSYFRA